MAKRKKWEKALIIINYANSQLTPHQTTVEPVRHEMRLRMISLTFLLVVVMQHLRHPDAHSTNQTRQQQQQDFNIGCAYARYIVPARDTL